MTRWLIEKSRQSYSALLKPMADSSFRVQTRYVLLTYSQCGDLDPWVVHDLIVGYPAECIIGREDHADGGTHLHAFVDFGRRGGALDDRRDLLGADVTEDGLDLVCRRRLLSHLELTPSGTIDPRLLHTNTPIPFNSALREFRDSMNGYVTTCLETVRGAAPVAAEAPP